MTFFRADLHCHSTCSDGSETPQAIVHMAYEKGLKALSITDHDSIDAYDKALPEASKLGIEMISGVEFSSVHKGTSVHILGYGFELENQKIINFCKEHKERRIRRCMRILELLEKQNMPISQQELFQNSEGQSVPEKAKAYGRPHIAMLMIKKGYVSTIQEAFRKYLGEGCCCYTPAEGFSSEETIDLIHAVKGVAIIAHPHLIKDSRILLDLLKMPFDGIECYYGKFGPSVHERWVKIATRRQWLITGGSDFHGDIKPLLPLGSSWIDEDNFLKLKQKISHE